MASFFGFHKTEAESFEKAQKSLENDIEQKNDILKESDGEIRKLKMELESLNTKLEEKNNALNTVQSEQNTTTDELTSKLALVEDDIKRENVTIEEHEKCSQRAQSDIAKLREHCHLVSVNLRFFKIDFLIIDLQV